MTALRVLMVSANYLPVMGGVETHIAAVAPRLIRAGVEVEILTTDRSGRLPLNERVNGVPVTRVSVRLPGTDLYLAPDLVRVLRAGDWDLIHCQGYHTLLPPLAMLAAVSRRMPFVLTFHSGGHASRFRHRLRAVQAVALRPLLSRARALIAVSRFEAELFARRLRLPTDRFSVIPNGAGVAADGQLPPVSPRAVEPDGALLLSVGRLERYKGHDRAIAALPHVIQREPTARLRIAGAGGDERALRDMAARLGVADRVQIQSVPAGDRHAMRALLNAAAVVLQLSEYESHGLAALEGVAAGRPVLVSGTSALAEMAEAGWATAVPPGAAPARIAAEIIDLLRAPRRGGPPNGLPTWDATATDLLALYRKVLSSAPGADT